MVGLVETVATTDVESVLHGVGFDIAMSFFLKPHHSANSHLYILQRNFGTLTHKFLFLLSFFISYHSFMIEYVLTLYLIIADLVAEWFSSVEFASLVVRGCPIDALTHVLAVKKG